VGDDAAAVELGPLTLVTADSLVEGVHFRREWSPPRLLGRKALSVNLSDIAAMAGVPRHATVSLCLPPETTMAFLDGLYDGLLERAAETGVNLVGGNLSASGNTIVVDVTLLGEAERILRRSGARVGDLVVLTGSLGASVAGLRLLLQGARLDDEGELMATGMWTETSAESVV
jgi:thiamine-monophosphate kinase